MFVRVRGSSHPPSFCYGRLMYDRKKPPTLSVAEAARFLGIGLPLCYAAIHRGEIPSLRIGKRIRVPTAALERMVEMARATA